MTQEFETRETGSERWNPENYPDLTPQERQRELVRIQALIDEDRQTPEQKAELFFEQALLYDFAEEYTKAIASYDKALEFKPDDTSAFYNKACCYALHSQIDQVIQNLQQAI